MKKFWLLLVLFFAGLFPGTVVGNSLPLDDVMLSRSPEHIRQLRTFQEFQRQNKKIPYKLQQQFSRSLANTPTAPSQLMNEMAQAASPATLYRQKMQELKAQLIYKRESQRSLQKLDVDSVKLSQTTLSSVTADAQTGAISGRVTNGLAGIPNVWIHAFDRNYNWIAASSTDGNGDYSITELVAEEYKLHFLGNDIGYINKWYNNKTDFSTADLVAVTADMTTTDIDAVLERGGSISGRVIDGAAAIAGVTISVYDSNYIWMGNATTDSNGQYILSGLPSGEHRVSFFANTIGYINEWYTDKADFTTADPVRVTAPVTTTNIDATLQRGGSLSGQVFDGNIGIADVWVYAYDSNYQWLGYSITNSNGEYFFTGLPIGDHKIEFSAIGTGYVSEWYTNKADFASADQVAVTGVGTTAGIDAVLEGDGVISGRVTQGGMGISDVSVYVLLYDDNYQRVAYTQTDVNGNYTITGLASNDYKVQFSPHPDTGCLGQWYDNKSDFYNAAPVTVTVPGVTTVDAALQLGGSITGRVTDGNELLSDVTVYVHDTNDPPDLYRFAAHTDANGEYTINPMQSGNYKLWFYHPDYINEWHLDKGDYDSANSVEVTSPNTTSGVDAVLQRGGRIFGQVTNANDSMPGVYVNVYDINHDYLGNTQTDSDGNYVIKGLPTGEHRVKFSPNSTIYAPEWYDDKVCFEDATFVQVTAPTDTTDINAVLEPGGSISGRVTDGMTDLADVFVEVFSCKNEMIGLTRTDSFGRYTITPLPPGDHKVKFIPSHESINYASEWYNDAITFNDADQVTVTMSNTTTDIDAVLEIGGSISGQVTSKVDTLGIYILVFDSIQDHIGTAIADDNGYYQVDHLPNGSHKVNFINVEYMYGMVGGITEWYNDKVDFTSANPVTVTAPATTTGINAVLGFENRFLLSPILMLLLDSP